VLTDDINGMHGHGGGNGISLIRYQARESSIPCLLERGYMPVFNPYSEIRENRRLVQYSIVSRRMKKKRVDFETTVQDQIKPNKFLDGKNVGT